MPETPSLIPKVLALPKYTWAVPESMRKLESDPHEFTIRLFTYGQEIDALKATRVTGATLEYELLQRCVVALDGKPVDQAGNILENFSPQVRGFMVFCLNDVASSDPKAVAAALAAVKIEVA